jgi:hypothetical protein
MIETLYDRALIVPRALRIALASRRATVGTGAVLLLFAIMYAMILPATYTGGAIGLVSLRFLTLGMFALALLMAVLLALTLALGVYGFRNGSGVKPAGSALGAILAALPPLLCCSPILPLAISAVAAILPAAGSLGVPIQGFIATHESAIYGVAIALMGWGLYGNARRVLSCTYRPFAASARTPGENGHACCEVDANIAVKEWR